MGKVVQNKGAKKPPCRLPFVFFSVLSVPFAGPSLSSNCFPLCFLRTVEPLEDNLREASRSGRRARLHFRNSPFRVPCAFLSRISQVKLGIRWPISEGKAAVIGKAGAHVQTHVCYAFVCATPNPTGLDDGRSHCGCFTGAMERHRIPKLYPQRPNKSKGSTQESSARVWRTHETTCSYVAY